MKGFINVIKPQGKTSARAVNAVKKRFNATCGHKGTLDPMASGVLPIGLEKTSRLFPYLLNKQKTYQAVVRFGIETDTLDITGNVINTCGIIPTEKDVLEILPRFIGEIEQIPPKYSAKCINGKRGYELARKGLDFTLQAKKVNVLDIKYLGQLSKTDFSFSIDCMGGTYIRSLARDFGYQLNTFGTLTKLDRTACGIFNYSNGITVDELFEVENIEKYVIPPQNALDFESITLPKKQAQKILDGVFDNLGYKDGLYKVFCEDEFWGVGESKDGVLKIKSYVR